MRVFEQLLDLGPNGIFAVTSTSGCYGTIPGQSHGRARLLRSGEALDRLEACTYPRPVEAQRARMAQLRSDLARAVAGVQSQLAWCEARISEGLREMPSQVVALDDRHVLVQFSAIKPYVFRVVDAVEGAVRWEIEADALRQSSGVAEERAWYSRHDEPLIREGGGGRVVIQLGSGIVVYQWDGTRLLPLRWTLQQQGYVNYRLTLDHVLQQVDVNRSEYQLLDPVTGSPTGSIAPASSSRSSPHPATSRGSNRVAFSHRGGTVDIVDAAGNGDYSIRPYPRAGRNDDLRPVFSHSARYLGFREWTTFRVVDLERRLVAEVGSPQPNMSDDPHEVLYDSDMIAADSRIALVFWGDLSFHDYDSLKWEPVVEPGKKGAAQRKPTEYKKHMTAWRKPALSLEPSGKGRSHLYGLSALPSDCIPMHQGEPMMLLAEIDLAEAAAALPENPWPKEGLLCFFAAADEEGGIREDDSFNPLEYRVVWHRGPPTEPQGNPFTRALPIALKVHGGDLPDISSPIVEGAHLDEPNLEAYREHLEKKGWLDQPNGHRLGGYPTILQNNDLEAQAAMKAGDLDDYPRDMAEVAIAARWRLLLQLDSDDEFMWGTDSGTLYFMIHDDDLARRDFSRVVALTEGY